MIVFYPLYPWLVRAVPFVCRNYFWRGAAGLGRGVHLRGPPLSPGGGAGPASKGGAAGGLVPLHFPNGLLFAHRLLGKPLPRAHPRVFAGRPDAGLGGSQGVLGALACLPRVNGLLLVPTLMVEAWLQYRVARRLDWRWLSMAAAGLGFAGYLLLNYPSRAIPSPSPRSWRDSGIKKSPRRGSGSGMSGCASPTSTSPRACTNSSSSSSHFSAPSGAQFRLRPTYAVWMTLNWLLINSTTYVVSVPRYCLTLFPIFILLAGVAAKRPLIRSSVTTFPCSCLPFSR